MSFMIAKSFSWAKVFAIMKRLVLTSRQTSHPPPPDHSLRIPEDLHDPFLYRGQLPLTFRGPRSTMTTSARRIGPQIMIGRNAGE